ncbi:hypothetical protein [Zobellella aerophila]|uniref:Lipoprotein n=1 Tax=Zobellella aerophila TaxID=870480 RepID=A0ABP6V8F9_9GAMM
MRCHHFTPLSRGILCGCGLIVLGGCGSLTAEGPEGKETFDSYVITLNIYDDYAQLNHVPEIPQMAKMAKGQLKGYANWSGRFCQIHYVHNDYETLLHELKHCFYGAWHE